MAQFTAGAHLKVVDGGSDTPKKGKKEKELLPGSKAWAESKRDEARALVKNIDTQYIQLGKLLWELYDVPVDNNPANKPSFSWFGELKFEAFCGQELGLHPRKAYTFRAIYFRLFVDLKTMESTLRDRIIALGWTKVRGVTRVLTLTNALSWVTYAEQHTAIDVESKVGDHLAAARAKKAAEEGQSFEAAAAGAAFDSDVQGTASKPASKKPASKVQTPDPTEATGADFLPTSDEEFQAEADQASDEPFFDPNIDNLHSRSQRNFYLLPEENELVSNALDLSKQLTGQTSPAVNLSLICMEFTATNTATPRANMTVEYKRKMLAQLEGLLGLQLLAIDPKTNNPIYASAALKAKAGDG